MQYGEKQRIAYVFIIGLHSIKIFPLYCLLRFSKEQWLYLRILISRKYISIPNIHKFSIGNKHTISILLLNLKLMC